MQRFFNITNYKNPKSMASPCFLPFVIFPEVSNMPDLMLDLEGLGESNIFFLSRKVNNRNLIPFIAQRI